MIGEESKRKFSNEICNPRVDGVREKRATKARRVPIMAQYSAWEADVQRANGSREGGVTSSIYLRLRRCGWN